MMLWAASWPTGHSLQSTEVDYLYTPIMYMVVKLKLLQIINNKLQCLKIHDFINSATLEFIKSNVYCKFEILSWEV